MARRSVHVTYGSADHSRIPDILTEGVAVVSDFRARGVLEWVGQRLRIRREGGYCGLDVFVLLWLHLSCGATGAIKTFWKVLRPCMQGVAALAGRKSLPSPSAVSRALGTVELPLLRPVADELLSEVAGIDELLRHPAVQTYDAHQRGWHVFDIDPVVVTMHQRALPECEELPEGRRRAEATGAPGYSGRKRGDLQYRQVPTMHAGAGVWTHVHLSAGNGQGVVDLDLALLSIVETCRRLEHPLERALVRLDGEHGNVPWFTVCRERGIPFITRLNRPKLYEDPDVLAALQAAIWHRVPDSGSGPQRSATDLGLMTIAAGDDTRRADGTKYEPVCVRVVASIFEKQGKAKRGRTIDGWQIELFAVDLPAGDWPAPEAIAAYYGRNGFENRVAQQRRELGLDRIASYHLPGQELATVIGLAVCNDRIVRGFHRERPPEVAPVSQLRAPVVDERVPAQWPRDPVVRRHLAALDWDTLLRGRPGWSFDAGTGELRCDQGQVLTLTTVRSRPTSTGRLGLIFRRPTGGCDPCPSRPDCLHSERPSASKHAEFSIDPAIAEALRDRRQRVRRSRTTPPEPATLTPIETPPGPLAIAPSLFLPAEARHAFREIFHGATLHVQVELPPPSPPRPRLVADDVAERQRRRKSWADNVARYALSDDAVVSLQVSGSDALRRFFGERRPRATASA